jgi:hypothetical protein
LFSSPLPANSRLVGSHKKQPENPYEMRKKLVEKGPPGRACGEIGRGHPSD